MTDLTETQREVLVGALQAGQGALADTAKQVSAGRMTAAQWVALATGLDDLRDLATKVGAGEPPAVLGS